MGVQDVDFYKKAALDAGVVGSIYIGGQYSNGGERNHNKKDILHCEFQYSSG